MNTDVFTLPRDLGTGTQPPPIVFYSAAAPSVKNRVILTQNLCCFLLSGIKKVHASDNCIQADGGELLMVPAGNVLMTETLTKQNQYEAILVFLSDEDSVSSDGKTPGNAILSKIPFDEFLENYIQSLLLLRYCGDIDLLKLKASELTIYLRLYYPQHYAAFKYRNPSTHTVLKFKQVISENLFKNLSVSELSFLCNMSISSFKRHFLEVYGVAPQRYFFQQRMMEAERLLTSGIRATEIFGNIGYESPAAFSSAFRKYSGCSPKQYLAKIGLPEKVFEPAAKQTIQYL